MFGKFLFKVFHVLIVHGKKMLSFMTTYLPYFLKLTKLSFFFLKELELKIDHITIMMHFKKLHCVGHSDCCRFHVLGSSSFIRH